VAAGEEGGTVGQADGRQDEQGTAAHPHQCVLAEAAEGELAPDRPHHDRYEGGEAELAQGGLAQGETTVDGGEQDVSGVGGLDRQR
jgi:hypothetical protein